MHEVYCPAGGGTWKLDDLTSILTAAEIAIAPAVAGSELEITCSGELGSIFTLLPQQARPGQNKPAVTTATIAHRLGTPGGITRAAQRNPCRMARDGVLSPPRCGISNPGPGRPRGEFR